MVWGGLVDSGGGLWNLVAGFVVYGCLDLRVYLRLRFVCWVLCAGCDLGCVVVLDLVF